MEPREPFVPFEPREPFEPFEPCKLREPRVRRSGAVRRGVARLRAGWPPAGSASVHSRVLSSIVAVTACAVLVFTVPLAVAAARIYREGAVARLQRDAIWEAAGLSGGGVGAPARLPTLHPPSHGVGVGVYGPSGHRVYGAGPAVSEVAERAQDGVLHQSVENGHLVVSAPVLDSGVVRAVVLAWTPWDPVADSTMLVWLVLAALGGLVVAVSALLAWRLARRVATPLERLTASARALGAGDFTIRPERTGMRETDAVWHALAATAGRLGDLLERERRFSTAVSHQLRTPLTALVLGLEAAQALDDRGRRQALATATSRAEHLGDTVEDLLRLARETHRREVSADVEVLLDRAVRRHRDAVAEAGRGLTVRCEEGLPPVSASAAAVGQILDTLMDNALVHGRGEITLTAADVGLGVALEVGDEGAGPGGEPDSAFSVSGAFGASGASGASGGSGTTQRDGRRHGIGLPLARSLAEAEGGRLLLRRAGPRPVFSLLLPVCEAPPATAPEPLDAAAADGRPARA